MYKDGRFAKHPRFRFFALNTEMRWRALQAGRIYVRQHPQDAQLSVQELRDLVGSENEAFSKLIEFFILQPAYVILVHINVVGLLLW